MEPEKDLSLQKNNAEIKERVRKESDSSDSPSIEDGTEKKSDAAREDKKGATGGAKKDKGSGPGQRRYPNNLREHRIEQMMSKAELARKAGLSVLTIDRIEKGYGCRMDTKRKILKALGLKLSDRSKVFQDA